MFLAISLANTSEKRDRSCENIAETNTQNYVPYLQLYGLYPKIENAIKYLSAYSDSLLFNVTNNFAESFQSAICTEVGGKRVFYGAQDSYNTRIAAAVVQHNTTSSHRVT